MHDSKAFILPWAGTVLLTPVVQHFGLYRTVGAIFNLRLVIVILSLFSTSSPQVGRQAGR